MMWTIQTILNGQNQVLSYIFFLSFEKLFHISFFIKLVLCSFKNKYGYFPI